MQQLKVNLLVTIPDELILITKVKYEEMENQQLFGIYWNMKDLEKRVNRKSEWIKTNILYPSRFRKELDVDNGGFVYYPKSQGQNWVFQASKMAAFLDDNFQFIFKKENR